MMSPPAPENKKPPAKANLLRQVSWEKKDSPKGSLKGSQKGSLKGSQKGAEKGSLKGAEKGSQKGSQKGVDPVSIRGGKIVRELSEPTPTGREEEDFHQSFKV